jgi:hypothetical protein
MSDGGYLSSGDLSFMSDYANSPVPYYTPSIGDGNAIDYQTPPGGGWSVDQFGKLVQYGVQAYGQIKAIDHGGYSGYPQASPQPAPQDQGPPGSDPGAAAPAAGFDWSQLTNFSTPYPYAIGISALLLVTIAVRVARR